MNALLKANNFEQFQLEAYSSPFGVHTHSLFQKKLMNNKFKEHWRSVTIQMRRTLAVPTKVGPHMCH